MKAPELERALAAAVKAAQEVGRLMRDQQYARKKVDAATQHDIKLALDSEAQRRIEKRLAFSFPGIPVLGEEGIAEVPGSTRRWVVDPIDGTVNFTYEIPHASVSIALQELAPHGTQPDFEDGYNTVLGVVLDPFCGELWTAIRGKPARLNGRITKASNRGKLGEAVVSIGFAKSRQNLEATLPYLIHLAHRVRKIRIMGSAALALTYVASGRFDAYIERGIRLWDIAAGGLILECAGGRFSHEAIPGKYAYRMVSSNGKLHRGLRVPT